MTRYRDVKDIQGYGSVLAAVKELLGDGPELAIGISLAKGGLELAMEGDILVLQPVVERSPPKIKVFAHRGALKGVKIPEGSILASESDSQGTLVHVPYNKDAPVKLPIQFMYN